MHIECGRTSYLGQASEGSGEIQEALNLYEQSIRAFRQVEDRWGIVTTLINMGRVSIGAGHFEQAASHLYEALDLSLEIHTPQHTVGTLVEFAKLFATKGQPLMGRSILEFLESSAVAWQEYQARAKQYLAEIQQANPMESQVHDENPAKFTYLDEVIEVVQAAHLIWEN